MMGLTKRSRSGAQLPAGERVYAVGDIHGEAALLEGLLAQIADDGRRRGPARTTLVLLGDVIDRGADPAGLVRMFSRIEDMRVVVLKGNHEAALVDCWRGNAEAIDFWLQYGGRATLAGFGISARDLETLDPPSLVATMQLWIDRTLVDWLDRLPLTWAMGDYLFVHAGIRPGVPLDRQIEEDLTWIREPFLSSTVDHGAVVVHGHSIEPELPRLGGNRIGLDTGGHEHRRLSALGLEGDRQWILQETDTLSAAARRWAAVVGTMADRPDRFTRIGRLIAAIAADPDAGQRPLLLRPEWKAADLLRSKGGWARPVAALVAAGVVGSWLFPVAWWTQERRKTGAPVTMAVPAAPAVAPIAPPPAASTPTRKARPQRRPTPKHAAPKPSAPPAEPVAAATPEAPTPHLTGAALDQALAEDRVGTRRLNEAELERIERKGQQ